MSTSDDAQKVMCRTIAYRPRGHAIL